MKTKLFIIFTALCVIANAQITITVTPNDTICPGSQITLTATWTGQYSNSQWTPTGGTSVCDTSSNWCTYTIQQIATTTYIFIVNADTATITVVSATYSTIILQPVNQNVNVGNNTYFTISASGSNITYQWQTDVGFGYQNVSNAGQYSGANNDTLTISNVTSANNNNYFRCTIFTYGCPDDTSNSALLTVTTGITEWNALNNISIFPNPSTEKFTLDSKIIKGEISIYNIFGEKLYSTIINNQSSIINLDSPNGIYFLHLKSENGTANKKLLLQK